MSSEVMSLKAMIIPGQVWQGGARTGYKRVKIVKVGDQPKRKRITFADLASGFTFTCYETVFRQDYQIIEDAPELSPSLLPREGKAQEQGLGEVFGSWPGEETDAELLGALDEIRHPVAKQEFPYGRPTSEKPPGTEVVIPVHRSQFPDLEGELEEGCLMYGGGEDGLCAPSTNCPGCAQIRRLRKKGKNEE